MFSADGSTFPEDVEELVHRVQKENQKGIQKNNIE